MPSWSGSSASRTSCARMPISPNSCAGSERSRRTFMPQPGREDSRSVGLIKLPAALLISPSIWPNLSCPLSSIFWTSFVLRTSPERGNTIPENSLNSRDVSSRTSCFRLVIIRLAPSSIKYFPMDFPSPVPPPVMRMVLSANVPSFSIPVKFIFNSCYITCIKLKIKDRFLGYNLTQFIQTNLNMEIE